MGRRGGPRRTGRAGGRLEEKRTLSSTVSQSDGSKRDVLPGGAFPEGPGLSSAPLSAKRLSECK